MKRLPTAASGTMLDADDFDVTLRELLIKNGFDWHTGHIVIQPADTFKPQEVLPEEDLLDKRVWDLWPKQCSERMFAIDAKAVYMFIPYIGGDHYLRRIPLDVAQWLDGTQEYWLA